MLFLETLSKCASRCTIGTYHFKTTVITDVDMTADKDMTAP